MQDMIFAFIAFAVAASPPGYIAYVSWETAGDRCVYVLDVASGGSIRVGPGKGDGAPRWSPDGEWLAFESGTAEGVDIYVVRADGTEGRYLNHAEPVNRTPRWSANGERLTYSSGEGLDSQIVVYDVALDVEQIWGGGRTSLIRPVWLGQGLTRTLGAVDGEEARIDRVFGGVSDEETGLIAVGFSGVPGALSTDLFLVTPDEALSLSGRVTPGKGSYAEWAVEPAGQDRALAFESDDGGDREIFVYRRGKTMDVSNHRAADWNPVWGPDGKWIAFESFRDGRRGVYRTHRDTARVAAVAVSGDGDSWSPSWSPDGASIAFISDRDGRPNLYVVEIGSEDGPARLTKGIAWDGAPAWRPGR